MYKYKQKSKNQSKLSRNKKLLAGALIIIAMAASSAGIYVYLNRSNKTASDVSTDTEQNVNYNPPTKEEINETEINKEDIANTPPPPSSSENKIKISPIITSSSQDEVLAFIPNVIEDGGDCIGTFTKDTVSFYKQSKGFKNASVTNCEPINLVRSDFASAGTWSVTLRYSSSKTEGESKISTFEVK